ncbi:MAG: hypothetical protein ACLGIC_13200 [Acidimicrobiia bacterium]
MHVVRVLPDVAGLDKEFDYSVPPELEAEIGIGSRVRVDLHGRRVGGWVVAVGVEPHAGITLRSVAKVTGWGPSADVVDLARWAAWRWAGRPSALLKAASPERAVRALPTNAPAAGPERGPESRPHSGAAEQPYGPGRTLVRVAPAADRMPVIRAVLRQGPALIVAPSSAEAAELGRRLRRDGEPVAVLPEGWAAARAGSCTVVGARSAAWAPAPDAAAMVVLDAHDEVHQEERAPTWHVRDVLGERAARAGVACLAVTPCPDLATVAWADRSAAVDRAVEREGWPIGEVIDLREEDPANGLLSSRLTTLVRGDQRVLCVLNRKGRARLLACSGCQEVARCELCDAAVTQVAAGWCAPGAAAPDPSCARPAAASACACFAPVSAGSATS